MRRREKKGERERERERKRRENGKKKKKKKEKERKSLGAKRQKIRMIPDFHSQAASWQLTLPVLTSLLCYINLFANPQLYITVQFGPII